MLFHSLLSRCPDVFWTISATEATVAYFELILSSATGSAFHQSRLVQGRACRALSLSARRPWNQVGERFDPGKLPLLSRPTSRPARAAGRTRGTPRSRAIQLMERHAA
jgi:hypothetical protein